MRRAFTLASLLLASALVVGCSNTGGDDSGQLKVATSTNVIADLARQVVGDRARVIQIVPDDLTPQNYEPVPQDAVALDGASLFFANGLGYESRVLTLADRASGLQIIPLSRGLTQIDTAIDHSDHKHFFANPYLYLDVANAIAYVEKIRDAMAAKDPDGTGEYIANAARYIQELKELDAWIEAEIALVPEANRHLMKDHASFPYFARRYGLEDLAANYEGTSEAAPSPSQYAFLIDEVRSSGIKVVFGEEGYSSKLMRQLAKDTGTRFVDGLRAATLGKDASSSSYVEMMRHNTTLIVDNLR